MAKVAAVATGLAMATSMLALAPIAHAQTLTDAQVNAIISLLQSFGADATTVANVQASLTGGTPVSTGGTTTGACSVGTANLTIGSSGAAVTCLQQTLIAGGYSIPAGATGYFGAQTRSAVAAWQAAKGITPAVGYFGSISRAAFVGTSTGGGTTPTTPGTTPITGNGLKVSLAADSPNNVALVQGQAIGSIAKFTFANPTATEIKVTNLAFKRIGVSNDATIANVYLHNGATRLTDSAGVSNTAFNFNDSTGLFTVPAGQTYTVTVLADIAASTSGQQVGAQLTSVTSTGTLDSSVALPISGYTQTVSAATLATVDFNTSTTPAENTALTPGNDITVWQNTVTIGTRAVTLKSFQLQNIGSIANTDVTNLRLYVDGVQTGTAASLGSNNIVAWDLSANPLRLETGGRVVKVVGDVVGGSSLTFKFSLRRGSDAQMVDTDLNQPVLATAASSAFSARQGGVQTIASGTVSVTKANTSPSSNVSLNASNVKWATFEMRAAGEDVKVDNLNVQADTTADHGLDNGKVFLNGVQVGSTKDLTDNADVNFTFGSSFILKAGAVAIVDIYADAKTTTGASFANGDTAQITLSTGVDNGTGVVSLSNPDVPGSDVLGNSITISSSTITLTKSSGYGNQTMLAGAQSARMGSFTLSTGSTEGVNVNTITVTLSTAEAATVTDLTLFEESSSGVKGAQIGTAKPTASDSNGFSVNFTIPASGTKVIGVYANIKSGSNIGPWAANIDGSGTGATTGSSVTFGSSSASTATLQTITLGTADLTTAVGVSPDNANVIAGASLVKVGSFRFTSPQSSAFTVDKIAVKVPANAATSITSVTLRYPNASGVSTDSEAVLALSSGAVQTHATATFTGLSFYIPANTSKNLDVYVSLATVASGATSGTAITAVLDADEGYRETDSSGTAGTTLALADLDSSATSGKGTMYVRKSIPTLSSVALDSTSLVAGTDQVLGRVKVTADAAGDIDWGSIVFTVNKTSAVSLGATTTVALWRGSNQVAGTFATTTGSLVSADVDSCDNLTTCSLHFRPTTVETIEAGTSRTYELRGTVDGLASGSSVNVSIANPQTSATTTAAFAVTKGTQGLSGVPSFVWSDWSDADHAADATATAAADWMTDYLVKTLPLTIGNRSVAFSS
ncbi:peptidoglycan-binding protein [Candidatus Kaiserbacteria bacterium]|nr:peptidoglycan-binding protein [Candidatus Kaiserbacteria bacterium]